MRRIVIWLAATVTIVVLLFGYHTSRNVGAAASSPATSSSSAPATTGSGGSTSGASPDPSPSPSASSSATKAPSSATKTYTGDVAQTRWGAVQVSITVSNGTITKVAVPQYPNGNPRDAEINARALPELVQEALDAQSAKIDMVSGATVTSDGYLQSLQSALDAAGI